MRKKFSACVRPGVDDVRARPRTPSRELMKLDFPTFERPRKAISGLPSRGQSVGLNALLTNVALVIRIQNQTPAGQRLSVCAGSLRAFVTHRCNSRHSFAH